MILQNHVLGSALTLVVAAGAASCATAGGATSDDTSGPHPDSGAISDGTIADGVVPASCDGACDKDGDGVIDPNDKCPNTPPKAVVNKNGCSDSQLTAKLEPTFPSYGLTWTPTGELGRAGGLTWTYTNIARGDLFHIDWIVCDDPALPCGLSLDGPIDVPSEDWTFSATDSNLPGGKLVFTNATNILLADTTKTPLSGRLTVTIVDANSAPIPFTDVGTLGVTARTGKYGAEIKGTGFKVVVLGEVEDTLTSTWTPYLDYYDTAGTADTGDAGGNVYTSFGGSFYDK